MNESVSAVRSGTGSENVFEWPSGTLVDADETALLQSAVHGRLADEPNKGSDCAEQPSAVGTLRKAELRGMPTIGDTSDGPPPGRKPAEQRSGEPPDVVRFLSQSLSLAVLRGERDAAGRLRALQEAIVSQRPLLYPSEPIEAAWASLSEEDQNRIRLDFSLADWELVPPFPLAESGTYKNRVQELRGAGNAINVAQAEGFIRAFMSVVDQ